MGLKLKTERQVRLIINNVVRACADIQKLNKTGYNYLYLCSGFIAHYNLYGFIDHYERNSLSDYILLMQKCNQWTNFSESDNDYEYYMQKAKIYNEICKKIKN